MNNNQESIIDVEFRVRRLSNCLEKPTLSAMEHIANININAKSFARRTNIICTLGPASQSVETIAELITAGMNIARLNFSHGSHEYHRQSILNVRAAEKLDITNVRKIGIALDTKGPEIRTGVIKEELGEYLKLEIGDIVTLTIDDKYETCCDKDHIYVTYERMANLVKKNQLIYIDDGYLSITVIEDPIGKEIRCEVLNGGKLASRKGVNLPDCNVDLPTVSEKDIEDLKFGLENNIDFVFASFIRNGAAIKEIRNILGKKGKHVQIIAKLENRQALDNLNEIIEASDGIMVARGDLGIEIPPEKVFVAQKKIITRCNLAGKPVICATQMLESMTNQPRATRAEVSDVANAVLDGADCIMLSGETAKGHYPIQCVQLMNAISRQAENCIFYKERFLSLTHSTNLPQENVAAIAATEAAFKINAPIIIVLTSTGKSAKLLSRYCPQAIIMAVTRLQTTARALNMYKCVHSIYLQDDIVAKAEENVNQNTTVCKQTRIIQNSMNVEDWLLDIEKRVEIAVRVAKQSGYVHKGDGMICVTGWRSGSGSTNTVRIMYCP